MRLLLISSIVCAGLLASVAGHAACSPTVSKPTGLYLDHGNGTVTDNQTGLMWQKCSLGLSDAACATGAVTTGTWQAALAAVQAANGTTSLGYSDWRLPNAKELASLTDKACESPAINGTVFPATLLGIYWTSSPSGQSADSAFGVDFSTGALAVDIKTGSNFIRLVRGGY